jgi:hypothetical protein
MMQDAAISVNVANFLDQPITVRTHMDELAAASLLLSAWSHEALPDLTGPSPFDPVQPAAVVDVELSSPQQPEQPLDEAEGSVSSTSVAPSLSVAKMIRSLMQAQVERHRQVLDVRLYLLEQREEYKAGSTVRLRWEFRRGDVSDYDWYDWRVVHGEHEFTSTTHTHTHTHTHMTHARTNGLCRTSHHTTPHATHTLHTHYTLHTTHYTPHTTHTLHTHYTLHTTHSTLHTTHCTLHTAHCTLHTAHYTLHSTHCMLHTHTTLTTHTTHTTHYTHYALRPMQDRSVQIHSLASQHALLRLSLSGGRQHGGNRQRRNQEPLWDFGVQSAQEIRNVSLSSVSRVWDRSTHCHE